MENTGKPDAAGTVAFKLTGMNKSRLKIAVLKVQMAASATSAAEFNVAIDDAIDLLRVAKLVGTTK